MRRSVPRARASQPRPRAAEGEASAAALGSPALVAGLDHRSGVGPATAQVR